MSSRRRAPSKQPPQEFALYKKLQAGDEENAAPEYIRIHVEDAEQLALAPVAASTPRTSRRRASTPGKRVLENDGPSPQTPRHRRASTPGKHLELPREEDSSLRTPPYPRRTATLGRPKGSVTPKLNRRDGIEDSGFEPEKLFFDEDGRGSPKERRRKSELAKTQPRRPDGKFISSKNAAPAEEDGYQTGDESDGEVFSGRAEPSPARRRSPAKKGRSSTPRAAQRAPVKEAFEDEVESDKAVVATPPPQRRALLKYSPKNAVVVANSSSSSRSGDSFNGITDYHKTFNTKVNVTLISDSNISIQSDQRSSSSDD